MCASAGYMKKQDAYWTVVTSTKQAKKLLLYLISKSHYDTKPYMKYF